MPRKQISCRKSLGTSSSSGRILRSDRNRAHDPPPATDLPRPGPAPLVRDVQRGRRCADVRRDPSTSAMPAVKAVIPHHDVTIELPFSSTRVQRVVSELNDVQKGFLVKHGLGQFLNVKRFKVPYDFISWIMRCTRPSSSEIFVGDHRIKVTKRMVNKVLGLPDAAKPVLVASDDVRTRKAVRRIKHDYMSGNSYPNIKVEEMIKDNTDEDSFIRSFMLLLISAILAPRKDNNVHVDYLYSLLNISEILSYDWADITLSVVMREVTRYQSMVNFNFFDHHVKKRYIEGCIPLLAIKYMDFMDLSGIHCNLNYDCSRICNITSSDFNLVIQADRNPSGRGCNAFGVSPFQILFVSGAGASTQWITRSVSRSPAVTFAPFPAGSPAADSHGRRIDTGPSTQDGHMHGEHNVLDPESQAVVDNVRAEWDQQFKSLTESYVNKVQKNA